MQAAYKMADNNTFAFLVLLVLSLLFPGVEAFDAGDGIALFLGLTIGILGICACLGVYARRRSNV
jgi:membrane-bound ClpP family serine protease